MTIVELTAFIEREKTSAWQAELDADIENRAYFSAQVTCYDTILRFLRGETFEQKPN